MNSIEKQIESLPPEKQAALEERAQVTLNRRVFEAAKERVPDVTPTPDMPRSRQRELLRQARREYAGKNPMFNRATRRALAKEVRIGRVMS